MLVPFHEDAFDIYILHYLSSFVVLLHPAKKVGNRRLNGSIQQRQPSISSREPIHYYVAHTKKQTSHTPDDTKQGYGCASDCPATFTSPLYWPSTYVRSRTLS